MEQKNLYNWRLVILATALSGASALIYEIIASRILLLFFGSALTSMTIVLIVFLGGLSLGSALMTVFKKRLAKYNSTFSILQLIIAFYGIIILSQFINLPKLLDALSKIITDSLLLQFIGGATFILIPTLLLGAIFPLAISLIIENSGEHLSARLGWLYTLDILGSVTGAALAGFFILPNYGNTATIILGASLNILAAIIIFPANKKLRLIILFLILLFLLTAAWAIKKQNIYTIPKNLATINNPYRTTDEISLLDKNNILWQKSSPWGTITVAEEETENGLDKVLSIDNWDQCLKLEHESESLIANGALVDKPQADVLNIGLGCGFTLASILENNPNHVTVAEINPVVYEAAAFFKEDTNNAIDDPRVDIIIKDGAELLRTSQEKYDVIIIDIEHPMIAHSSPLYTVEYLRYAKERLKDNGRLALWGYFSNDNRYLKSLVSTLKAVFNNAVFAEFGDHPANVYLFLASDQELDAQTIDAKGNAAELAASLEAIEDVPINTLDNQVLQKYFK